MVGRFVLTGDSETLLHAVEIRKEYGFKNIFRLHTYNPKTTSNTKDAVHPAQTVEGLQEETFDR